MNKIEIIYQNKKDCYTIEEQFTADEVKGILKDDQVFYAELNGDPVKNWSIHSIENANESIISALSREKLDIKGFNVYLIDFKGCFGFSACVFKNGRHIYHANDYELHHKGRSPEELKSWYIDTLNHKLFTDEEISEKIVDYSDYQSKDHFIRNYYPVQYDHLSMFHIFHNEQEEKEFDDKQQKEYPYICKSCFSYFKDQAISDKVNDLLIALQFRLEELKNDFEYWKSAIKYEMYNHEYCYNTYQGDFDVIGCFARVKWCGDCAGMEEFLRNSTLTDVQKKAYRAARTEYFAEIGDDY